jgi:shikimate kinase
MSVTQPKSNIVLIGMPGCGKSTIGVLLAKLTSRAFLDTDLLIQTVEGRTLQDIVDQDGYMALRKIEEAILLGLDCRNNVIATGGSAAYSSRAMAHLRSQGTFVFLDVDLTTLESRINDFATRGLAKSPSQTLADLFTERRALYQAYADLTIDGSSLNQEAVCESIIRDLAIAQ